MFWVKGQALLFSIHTISCSKIIPPCNYSGTFDVNQENIHLWVYLWILCSVPVVHLSILAPKVLCVNYSSFVVNVEICWLSLPTLRTSHFFIKNFFLYQDFLDILGPLYVHIHFGSVIFSEYKGVLRPKTLRAANWKYGLKCWKPRIKSQFLPSISCGNLAKNLIFPCLCFLICKLGQQ